MDKQEKTDVYQEALDAHKKELELAIKGNDKECAAMAYVKLGKLYSDHGNHDDAINSFQDSLAIAKETNVTILQKISYFFMAEIFTTMKNSSDAIDCYEKWLKLATIDDQRDRGVVYDHLGTAYQTQDKYQEAIGCHEKSLEIAESLDDQKLKLQAYKSLGNLHATISNFHKAIDYYKKYLDLGIRLNDKSSEAVAYQRLGQMHAQTGDYDKAADCSVKAIKTNVTGDDKSVEAIANSTLGIVYLTKGDYEKGMQYSEQSLQISISIGFKHGQAQAYNNLGTGHHYMGNYYEAIKYKTKALETCIELGKKIGIATAHIGLGGMYEYLGQYHDAFKHYKESKEISIQIGDRCGEGRALCGLGNCFQEMKKVEEAVQHYEKALAIVQEVGDRMCEIPVYLNLVKCKTILGQYQEAMNMVNEQILLAKEMGDKNLQSIAYDVKGNLCLKLDDSQQTIDCFENVLKISQELGNKTVEADGYRHLGIVYWSLAMPPHENNDELKQTHDKKIKEQEYHSMKNGEEKREFNEKKNDKEKRELNKTKNDEETKKVSNEKKKDEEKREFNENKNDEVTKRVSNVNEMKNDEREPNRIENGEKTRELSKTGNDEQKKSDSHEMKSNDEKKKEPQEKNDDKMKSGSREKNEDENEKRKEYVAKTIFYFKEALRCDEWLFDHLQQQDSLKISLLETFINDYKTLTNVLMLQNEHEEALLVSERGRARALNDVMVSKYNLVQESHGRDPISHDQIKSLAKDSDILFYSARGNSLSTWTIDTAGSSSFVLNVPELSDTVDSAYDTLKIREMKYEDRLIQREDEPKEEPNPANIERVHTPDAAEELLVSLNEKVEQERCIWDEDLYPNSHPLENLYNALISPLHHLLTKEEIVIIPDGVLFTLPFAALRNLDTEKFLSETKRIRIAPSLTSLKTLQECPADFHSKTGALIIGNPKVGKVIFKGNTREIDDLPCAEREAKTIGKLLDVQPYIGIHATKENIKKNLREGVAVIHFAAHGTTNGEIFLAPSSTQDLPNEDDYILTMKEVQESGVRPQLVVLSCCHSGRGEIKGEGVVGMSRAFLAAGARAVVASLWAIADEATMVFMEKFYTHLKHGESASKSLQAAMKDMRGMPKYNNEQYWSPFFLIGDDVTIEF